MGLLRPIRSLSSASSAYPGGIHKGHPAGLLGIEPNLLADNIKWNTTIFGVLGTMVIWRWTFAHGLTIPAIPSVQESLIENHSGGNFPESKTLAIPTIPSVTKDVVISSIVLDDCEAAWDEYTQANVISAVDNADYKVGTGSAKLDMAAAAVVGRLATHNFGPIDGRVYNYIKVWLKSSINIVDNELSILLDNHAQCVSPEKDLNIGALTANTWTEKTLALGDASGLSALISVGIDQDVDKGAFTLRIDQVRLTKGA
jgi:hypothetical protein